MQAQWGTHFFQFPQDSSFLSFRAEKFLNSAAGGGGDDQGHLDGTGGGDVVFDDGDVDADDDDGDDVEV